MAKRVWIGNAKRMEILIRDNLKCFYCGADKASGAILEVDHVLAVSRGWTNDDYNLVTSCRPCNRGKFVKTLDELESTRLKNAEEKLKDVKKIQKEKNKLYKIAQELIEYTGLKTKRSPEFLAYKQYIIDLWWEIIKKNERPLEVFIETYGLEKTIELTNCMEHMIGRRPVTAPYLQGIYNNKRDENGEYYLGHRLREKFKEQVLNKIEFNYEKNKSRIESSCKRIEKVLWDDCRYVNYDIVSADFVRIYLYTKEEWYPEHRTDDFIFQFFLKETRAKDIDWISYIGDELREQLDPKLDYATLTKGLTQDERENFDTTHLSKIPPSLSTLDCMNELIDRGIVISKDNDLYI